MSAIHPSAANGFAAGSARYARGRPDYPAALDHWLRARLGLGPGKVAIDLGAGTGKFTPRLMATGARVIAVEPVAPMRARLAAALPAVTALEGTAEAIPLADGSADAVLCAQSFHWFASAAALAEIRRVLKPGGKLGLVWNVRDGRVAWVKRLAAIIDPYAGDSPRFQNGDWQRLFPAPGFGPLELEKFPHGHTGAAEQVILDRTLSTSFVAALPDATRDAVATAVRALIAGEPELAGKAVVTMPYETSAYCAETLG